MIKKPKKYLNILKILYEKDKRFLKAFLDLVKYKKLFLEAKIKLENCNIVLGVNIILLLNKKDSVVYRCSLNRCGYIAVLRNHGVLTDLESDNIPKPRGLWKDDNFALSAESLVQGDKLKTTDVDPGLTTKILRRLRPIYKDNIVRSNFSLEDWFKRCDYLLEYYNPLWEEKLHKLSEVIIKKSDFSAKKDKEVMNTRIHGDLTFRNIMLNGKGVVFFDFDRSLIDFPEFDIFLFCIDSLTYRKGLITYDAFFDYIIQFINGRIDFPEILEFYNLNREFSINRRFDKDIRRLFIYRMLVLILQTFNKRQQEPLKLLDKVINEIL